MLVGRQEEHPACKQLIGGVWRGYLSGVRCRLAYGPADATATLSLASIKSRLVLPFWYRLTWVVPDKRAVKRVCVCVVTRLLTCSLLLRLHAAGLVFFLVLRRLIFQNPELRELSRWPFTSDSSVCDVWGTVYRSNNSVFSYCDITCVLAEPTAANPPKKRENQPREGCEVL